MIRTIDWFNEHFKECMSPLVLDEQNLEFYQLYMAKKTGKPNDDFPSNNNNDNNIFILNRYRAHSDSF